LLTAPYELVIFSAVPVGARRLPLLLLVPHLVLVIDEYPYLAKSYPGISSLLQVEIDHRLSNSNMFLILCGSSMSFMENQVMGHKSPLYGRRTGQIKVLPFDYETSAKFCMSKGCEDRAIIYGITGGIAKYTRRESTWAWASRRMKTLSR